MGLKHYNDSDTASDLAYVMQNAMAEVLRKGLKDEGNWCNTSGVVNVAMIFRDLVVPNIEEYCGNEKLQAVAKETYSKLFSQVHEDNPDDWGSSPKDKENRREHMEAYRKMLSALKKYRDAAY
jgi:hypothetical protein